MNIKRLQKIVCFLLCCTMLLGIAPTAFMAPNKTDTGLCKHHLSHNGACSYYETGNCIFVCEICNAPAPDADGSATENSPEEEFVLMSMIATFDISDEAIVVADEPTIIEKIRELFHEMASLDFDSMNLEEKRPPTEPCCKSTEA